MRHSIYTGLLCAAAGFAPLTAAADPSPLANREPGLWEVRLVDGSSLASVALGVEKAVTGLPENQRKHVERLLGGSPINLPTVTRYCVTPAMKEADFKSELVKQGINCSQLEYQEAGGNGRFAFVCTNVDGDYTGEGRITEATAKHFRAQAKVQAKYKGQRLAWDMTHEGQWLGSDCMGVKPYK